MLSGWAVASLMDDFTANYFDESIYFAVEELLKEGIHPNDIMRMGLDIEGLNPQNLVMALYCAGVKGRDIQDSADINGVSELIVTAGYKKSIVECSDAVTDSQAYTPVATGFSGGKSAGSGGNTFVSPATFN